MTDYVEIDDLKVIKRLNAELADRLRSELIHNESRYIGWPAGRFLASVWFRNDSGTETFWWTGRKHGSAAHNLFGHGTPNESTALNIDVQFNLPTISFDRRTGGAFLMERQTGKILLAHRGIATLGHGRVSKQALFHEMYCTLRSAETSNGDHDFLLIGELDSSSLVDDLAYFSSELRRSVGSLSSPPKMGAKSRKVKGTRRPHGSRVFGELRKYFDEFSGKKKVSPRRQAVIADCHHGSVVRELRDVLGSPDNAFKSLAIDLVILEDTRALLIEVKTSASTQNIYSAIGQLLVHAPSVAALGKLKVEKVIVLPQQPSDQFLQVLTQKLKIHLLIYTRSKNGRVSISGTNALQ